MLILGMDPGSLCFGVGIIERSGKEVRHVHSAAWSLGSGGLYQRMGCLWARLDSLFGLYTIREAAMEEGFLGQNVHSLSVLSVVRGVAMAALIERGGRLGLYSPRQVKQALTGYGNASKPQVSRMVSMLLKPPVPPKKSDESDALAVAYCHAVSLP